MEDPQEGSSSEKKTSKKRSTGKRTLQDIALQFIERDNLSGHCRIDKASGCRYVQATYDVGNFIRHFRSRHPEAANKNGLLKDEEVPEKKPRLITKRPVAIDGQLFLESIVKLVTYHHLPLACVEWEGLKQLIDPLAAAVGISVSMNKNNLKAHLQGIAQEIRVALAEEMRYKLISIKIDSASRLNRHVLGVNVQYAVGEKVVIRTIGRIISIIHPCKHLKNTHTHLKTSRAFQMALYLDPRLNYLHSKLFHHEEKQIIQNYIMDTWERIRKLRSSNEAGTADKSTASESSQFDDFITDLFGGSLSDSMSNNCTTFVQQLKAQDAEPRQNLNQDVWEYWLKRMKSHPELFEVAMVVLSAPSNQVSVERAFSALALVLSPHRAGLGQDALENILHIKLNRDVFEKVMPTYKWNEPSRTD